MSVAREQRQARAYELLDDLARALHETVPTPLPVVYVVLRVEVELAASLAGRIDDARALAIDQLLVAARDRLERAGIAIIVDSSDLLVASVHSDDPDALSVLAHVRAELAAANIPGVGIVVRSRHTNDLSNLVDA